MNDLVDEPTTVAAADPPTSRLWGDAVENVIEPEGAFPTHWRERALRLAEDQGRPPIQAPPMEP